MKTIQTIVFLLSFLSLNAQFRFDISGASATYITGINDTVSIVGYCMIDGETCGFYYNSNTNDTIILKPSDINGAVSVWFGGINNHELVGGHYSDATNTKAFMFNPINRNVTYPYSYVASAGQFFKVNDINDNNVVSGDFQNGAQRRVWAEGPSLAFSSFRYYEDSDFYNSLGGHGLTNDNRLTGWYIDGNLTKSFILDIASGDFSKVNGVASTKVRACGINDANAMAVEQTQNFIRSYRYFSPDPLVNSTMTVAEILVADAVNVHVLDINNNGNVCGWYDDKDGVVHGFYEKVYDIRFRPDPNAYNVENTANPLWLPEDYANLNYRGDPYRGPSYPFGYNSGTPIDSSIYPSWPLWVRTFGPENIYVQSPYGTSHIIPAAFFKWEAAAGKFEGACFGMASNSITAWDSLLLLRERFPSVNYTRNMGYLFLDKESKENIHTMQVLQYSAIAQHQKDSWQSREPKDALGAVKAALADSNGMHPVLGIYVNDGDNAFVHALVPYKIKSMMDPSGYLEIIYCYDPNKPLSNSTGLITAPSNYKSLEWKYPKSENVYLSTNAMGSLKVFQVSDLYSGSPGMFLKGGPAKAPTRELGDQILSVVGQGSTFRIGEGGKYAGPWNGTIMETLTSANMFVPMTGTKQRPRQYFLPKSGNYSIEMKREEPGAQVLHLFRDGLIHKFKRSDAQTGDTDLLYFSGDTLRYPNPSASPKTIQLITSAEDSLSKATLTYIVDSLSVPAGSTISTHLRADKSLGISNSLSSGFYNLQVHSLTAEGPGYFRFDSIPFGPNTEHILIPDMDSLATKGVLIVVDLGQDKIYDDTLFLQNKARATLFLSKQSATYNASSGADTIGIINGGGGILNWTVSEKPDWVDITEGENGAGQGQIRFTYEANSGLARNGMLVVRAEGALNSPDTVMLYQEAVLGLSPEAENEKMLGMHPNPASDKITLTFSGGTLKGAKVLVYDLSGKLVLSQQCTNLQPEIGISVLEKGIYILQLNAESGTFRQRFMKW